MSRILATCGIFAVAAVLLCGMPGKAAAQSIAPPAAASGPAIFECPWTPVSGTNPSAEGCYGGGDDGCGGSNDSEPDIPCEEQNPPKTTSPPPSFDYAGPINTAKAELIAEGEDLTGANCGKIVERACRYFPAGVGLLEKTYGNQYNGHSVDFIMMPDGQGWDVIVGCGDAGGGNAGVGNSGCCGPKNTGTAADCEPNDRYIPCSSFP